MSGRSDGRLRLRSTPAALVLGGGGARAAYQVGVLKAIAEMLRDGRRGLDPGLAQGHNPFPILVGASAGAINAAALAAGAGNFQDAVERMVRIWENFHAEQVYRSDFFGVLRSGARWLSLLSLGWLLRRSLRARPRSLLDNTPLRELLEREIRFADIGRSLEHGHLQALAVCASSYSSGRHVTFYESLVDREIADKYQRISVRARIGIDHLLASSAIPFVFPAVAIDLHDPGKGGLEHFGDGAMRQLSPVSPAIHLGAERILAIGVGQAGNPGVLPGFDPVAYPSLAQVAGHALSTIFLDAIVTDAERLEKMNQVASTLTEHERRASNLRIIEFLMISPSERLDAIAARYLTSLPGPVRVLLESLGTYQSSGAGLASYLLFESKYTRALIDLGHSDALARRDQVMAFLAEPGEEHAGTGQRVVVL